MGRVKGSIFLNYVRIIRANKERDWGKYLTDADLKLVFSEIMAHRWHPLDAYERIGYAIFQELAQGKMEIAWQWGRFAGEDIGKRYYHYLTRADDPLKCIEWTKLFVQQGYQFDQPDFQALKFETLGPNQVKILIQYDHPSKAFAPYVYQVAGTYERLVEINGGKEVKVDIVKKNIEGSNPCAEILVSWK